jgi:hypothetical protein
MEFSLALSSKKHGLITAVTSHEFLNLKNILQHQTKTAQSVGEGGGFNNTVLVHNF